MNWSSHSFLKIGNLFYDQIYSQLGYGAGIQYHIVPFVTRTGADFNDFEVTENNIAMVSLGGYNKIFLPPIGNSNSISSINTLYL